MLSVLFSCLVPVAVSFPHLGLVNQGPQLGPLTPAYGDLVQTPRGLSSISLEGFSEDLDQDGYVDPVGQATVPVAAPVAVAHAHVAPIHAVAHAAHVHTHAVAHVAPVHTHAVAAAPIAAPAYTYDYAAPLAAAAPVHVAAAPVHVAAAPVAAAVHSHYAVAPAATVPLAAVHSYAPVAHAVAPVAHAPLGVGHHHGEVLHGAVHHHGGCVNNLGSLVPCAL